MISWRMVAIIVAILASMTTCEVANPSDECPPAVAGGVV